MEDLNIFYSEIIKEAFTGNIECFFTYNILFGTIIPEADINCVPKKEGFIIPILHINNKKYFDELLLKYITLAKKFYLGKMGDEVNTTKALLANLFANATYEDFSNPISFLNRRISFLENKFNNVLYSNTSYGDIYINFEEDYYLNETPLKMQITMKKDNDVFYFPSINFGICNGSVYIYTIHNQIKKDNEYSKKLNRLFYKINENYITSDSLFGLDKDITPSFVIALSIFLKYFSNLGYSIYKVNTLLIVRYNSKKMANNKKELLNKEITLNQNEDFVQRNLTDKYINTFYRLINNSSGIEVVKLPYDSSFIDIKTDNIIYNNNFLNELQQNKVR